MHWNKLNQNCKFNVNLKSPIFFWHWSYCFVSIHNGNINIQICDSVTLCTFVVRRFYLFTECVYWCAFWMPTHTFRRINNSLKSKYNKCAKWNKITTNLMLIFWPAFLSNPLSLYLSCECMRVWNDFSSMFSYFFFFNKLKKYTRWRWRWRE